MGKAILDYPGGLREIKRVIRVREGVMRMEAEVEVMPLMERRPQAKEYRQPLEAGKGKGHILHQLQQELSPANTFIQAFQGPF